MYGKNHYNIVISLQLIKINENNNLKKRMAKTKQKNLISSQKVILPPQGGSGIQPSAVQIARGYRLKIQH